MIGRNVLTTSLVLTVCCASSALDPGGERFYTGWLPPPLRDLVESEDCLSRKYWGTPKVVVTFPGDTHRVNEVIETLAEFEDAEVFLTLYPDVLDLLPPSERGTDVGGGGGGEGELGEGAKEQPRSPNQLTEEATWTVTIMLYQDAVLAPIDEPFSFEGKPTYFIEMSIYVGRGVDLAKLKVPEGVSVEAGRTEIDAFVEERNGPGAEEDEPVHP